MIYLLKRSFLFLLLLTYGAPFAVAQSVLKLEALPQKEILPIERNCSCLLFPREGLLRKDNVLFLIKSAETPALIKIEGKTRSLAPRPVKPEKNNFINEYSNPDIQVRIESWQVSYKNYCSSYPQSPTEGSCFLGTMTVTSKQGKLQQKVVELCGC